MTIYVAETTSNVSDRDDLISYISDGYKDAHGFRPRHFNFASMSMEELEKLADRVEQDVRESMEEEEAADARAKADFEAQIESFIANGAADRETAIRWMLDAVGLSDERDAEYIAFCFGLSYSEAPMFESLFTDTK